MYDEFYVRICAEDYDSQGHHNSNLYMSLANNTVSKSSSSPKLHHDNMMFMDDFDSHLKVDSSLQHSSQATQQASPQ